MLDMGFMPQIRRILVRCKQERRNLMFSATMPREVSDLCKDFLPDAHKVQVGRRSHAPTTITHDFQEISARDKTAFVKQLLRKQKGRVLVFVKTKLGAQRLGRALKAEGLPADSIHGDKSAEARYAVLTRFDRGKILCMVATDVAARGIDVDDIELVVNYDLPQSVEDYVHRVGRTGRIGKVGRALSLVSPPSAASTRRSANSSMPRPTPRPIRPPRRPRPSTPGAMAADVAADVVADVAADAAADVAGAAAGGRGQRGPRTRAAVQTAPRPGAPGAGPDPESADPEYR